MLGQGLRLSSSEAAVLTAVPGGYNEDWVLLSDPLRNTPRVPASPTFAQRVRKAWDGYANYARTGVDWTTVRTTPVDRATSWASYDPMNAAFAAAGCENRSGNITRSGIRLLAVVSGCPPEFAETTQSGGPGWAYPRDEHLADFGHFVAETVKHFHQTHGNVTAVEIWNEPNLETFGAVPAGKLAGMINATRDAIVDYKARGQIPQDFTIISGGLSLTARSVNGYRDGRPNLSPWETYLEDFMQRSRDHSAYHVGVHCYDLRENPTDPTDVYTGVDMATAVMRAKTHMLQDQFDTFKTRTHTRQIWVTEVGCSSRQPWGLVGQSQVLAGLARGFATRGICQAMIAYRLYPSLDPTFEPPTNFFYQFSVCNADNTNKNGYGSLRDNWTPDIIIT